MEEDKRFLPIGTVVLLKGGNKELMINGYCIKPYGDVYGNTGKIDAGGTIYDYGACIYPEGLITNDQLFAFNHDQIDRICFMGYETNNQQQLSELLKKGLAKLDEIKKEES